MTERKRSDYSELRSYLREKDTVSDIALDRRMIDHKTSTDLYLRFVCDAAGINLWEIHEKFDVDVVFAWHDPTTDELDMGLRINVEES